MLSNRWSILALLFAVRTGMGLQYQAVAALSPMLMADLSLTVADIGLLIGLYHAPGAILAFPGGAIGARLGDRRVVLIGLALMIAGELAMALVPAWSMQIAGRLLAGIGGILLNVSMTKMVADWFAGREINTAMAIFGNSAPFGIALALLALPSIAGAGGRIVGLVRGRRLSDCGARCPGLAVSRSAGWRCRQRHDVDLARSARPVGGGCRRRDLRALQCQPDRDLRVWSADADGTRLDDRRRQFDDERGGLAGRVVAARRRAFSPTAPATVRPSCLQD